MNGIVDMTWDEMADIINDECREDGELPRTEAAYRKLYSAGKMFYEQVFADMLH